MKLLHCILILFTVNGEAWIPHTHTLLIPSTYTAAFRTCRIRVTANLIIEQMTALAKLFASLCTARWLQFFPFHYNRQSAYRMMCDGGLDSLSTTHTRGRECFSNSPEIQINFWHRREDQIAWFLRYLHSTFLSAVPQPLGKYKLSFCCLA